MDSGSPRAASRGDWEQHVRPRLSALRLSPVRENEIVDELSQHLEDRRRELVDGGASEDEATRQALALFRDGNWLARYLAPLRQAQAPAPVTPGAPAGHLLRGVWQDVRHATRMLRNQPGFTLAAVLTLALGIGANTAIFSIVNAVLLEPLPYPEPSRLFVVQEGRPESGARTALSAENFLDVQREARSFEALGAYAIAGFTLSDRDAPESILGQTVSAELLDALGVAPLLGRSLRPDENEAGRDQVMLLSHGLWQRRYGGDRGVVGRTVTANGTPYTVVGVMPADFAFPGEQFEVWVPFAFRGNTEQVVNRGTNFLGVAGRLRDGTSPEQAQAELAAIASRLETAFPDVNADYGLGLASLTDETVGSVRTALLLVLSAVAFVLLIACANVTNLLLARASTREREMAVRAALGASRARVVGQLLAETLVLYAIGAGAGLVLAAWGLDALVALSPGDIPRLDRAALDPATLAFTLGITLVTGIAVGLVPALHATRRAPARQLQATTRSATTARATRRARGALVTAEVALSLMLMVGAGLAARTLVELQRVDTGFDADGALAFGVVAPDTGYPDGDTVRRFHREVVERLSMQAGAVAVGATSWLPLSGEHIARGFTPEGWPPASEGQQAIGSLRGVEGRPFEALGARVTAGRAFTDGDGAGSRLVAMVNDEFARRYWPGQDPIGKRVKEGRLDGEAPWRVVVGVYVDLKQGPAAEASPEVTLPYAQLDDYWTTQWMRGLSVVVRTANEPTSLIPAARAAVRSIDPSVPVVGPRRMTEVASDSMAHSRFRSTLLVAFAGLAVLLAVVGIYGVVGFNVEQRTHEVSVRIALGAQRASVVLLILRQESVPIVVGVVLGLAGAVAVGRAMRGLLFEVTPTDPVTFLAMPALLGAVALVGCLVPARRALGVEAAAALRAE
jgi:putative ABC transport system permease protein